MRYLLDTCMLLWALENDTTKLAGCAEIILNPRNYIAVSVVSYWEIAIKKSLGKLKSPDNLIQIVEESGFTWINLEPKHVQQLEQLPQLHTDPFDRLLIAQALSDRYNLLTTDKMIYKYINK
jgi:PIN domain nuclease of toxin-antitoxin system